LKDLASHYIKEMQQLQPHGPYYLMGFSFGGLIAYEMACQLVASGHPVNFVGMMDTNLKFEKQLRPLHQIVQNVFRQSPGRFMESVKSKIINLVALYKYGTDFWPHRYTLAPDIACKNGYQPQIYNGSRVDLFQGGEFESKLYSCVPPERAWKKLLGDRLEVQQVSGSHFEMFREPHVKMLAAKIIACMDRAINSG
jgi:thioesterase domain-containing protein